MGWTYHAGKTIGRFIFIVTMNTHVINARIPDRQGGYLLALTHLSHVEPFCASVMMRRRIDWMARKEFYRYRVFAWLLHCVDAFIVNRQGIPVSAIRAAIARIRDGRVVGICPEGGVVVGKDAAIRGGAIKRGICSIALRTGAPIIPCVMLGTDRLNRVMPWLPTKSAHLWVAYGEPIYPPKGSRSTRASRRAVGEELRRSFQAVYRQLLTRYQLEDSRIP